MQENKNLEEYEEEINIFEIITKVKKYKKPLIKILVSGVVLSLVLALCVRNYNRKEVGKQSFSVNYEQFDKKLVYYEISGISYNKFNPQMIVQSEEYIDKFLEIKEFKEAFSKIKTTPTNINEKKAKFISSRIKIEQNKTQKENYDIKIITLKKSNITEKVAEVYFKILTDEIIGKLNKIIQLEKEESIKLNKEIENKLNVIKEQTSVLVQQEARISNVSAENLDYIIKMKEPLLMSEKDFQQMLYARTSKEINGINQIIASKTLDGIILKNTSLIIEDEVGKEKLVLLLGIILTVGTAIGFVLFKEFINNYKKYEEENEKK